MWQGQGRISLGSWWSALWPQLGQKVANRTWAVVILQCSSFQSRGQKSQRVISLAPGGVRGQRSQTRLQGEGLNHQSVALQVISAHIDNIFVSLICMAWYKHKRKHYYQKIYLKKNNNLINLHHVRFCVATLDHCKFFVFFFFHVQKILMQLDMFTKKKKILLEIGN